MIWKIVNGYKWPYRVSDTGRVQKFYEGSWVELTPYISGSRTRAMVKMRSTDNRKIEVPLVWLIADAFMGGRRSGYDIIHKNGMKLDCAVENLKFSTRSETAKLSAKSKRKAVCKIAPDGEIIEIYASTREAAKKNYMGQSAIWNRCVGRTKDPFGLDGFTYQYEDAPNKRGRKKAKK